MFQRAFKKEEMPPPRLSAGFCTRCCGPFALLGGILMMVFSMLIQGGNLTFAVIGAENKWDMKEKAHVVLTAGIIYFAVSFLFFARYFYLASERSLADFNPFSRRRHTRESAPLMSNDKNLS